MGNVTDVSAKGEWARGWKIPLVSAFAYAWSFSHVFTLGVFMPSIEESMDWSRSQISAGVTFVYIMLVFMSPLLGRFVDRFGARPIALIGTFCYCLSISCFSLVGESIWYWWGMWFTLAIGHIMLATPVWATAVVTLFTRARGMALAVTLSGAGLSSAFMPVIADNLQVSLGWRGAYVVLGLGGGVIVSIFLGLFFRPAQGRIEGGSREINHSIPNHGSSIISLRQALCSPVFIKMTLAGFLIMVMIMAFMVHFVPMLIEGGIGASTAAGIASVIGFSAMGGRLVVGALLDRVRATFVGAVVFALPVVVGVIMLTAPGVGLAVVCAILIGFTLGAEYDVIAYSFSRYFDMRLYGRLFGVFYSASSLAGALGPLVGGFIYDYLGDYRSLFLLVIPLSIFNSILIGLVGPYPDRSTSTSEI